MTQTLPLSKARVTYTPNFLSTPSEYYNDFLAFPWATREAVYNEDITYKLKRATCAFGDSNVYAPAIWGKDLVVIPWPDRLHEIKDKIEAYIKTKYNICLCNYYENGRNTIGWHSDREEALSPANIASISLGAPRKFAFQSITKSPDSPEPDAVREYYEMVLEPGSLLVMGDGCQEEYRHALLLDKDVKDGRINLTFRLFEDHRYGKY